MLNEYHSSLAEDDTPSLTSTPNLTSWSPLPLSPPLFFGPFSRAPVYSSDQFKFLHASTPQPSHTEENETIQGYAKERTSKIRWLSFLLQRHYFWERAIKPISGLPSPVTIPHPGIRIRYANTAAHPTGLTVPSKRGDLGSSQANTTPGNHTSKHSHRANRYHYPTCDLEFTNRTEYGDHFRDKHGIAAFKCDHCSKSSTRFANLATHIKRCHVAKRVAKYSTNTHDSAQKTQSRPSKRRRVSIRELKQGRSNNEESGLEDEDPSHPPKNQTRNNSEFSFWHMACPFAKGAPESHRSCLPISRQNLAGVKYEPQVNLTSTMRTVSLTTLGYIREHLKRRHYNRQTPIGIRDANSWNDLFDYCFPNWAPRLRPSSWKCQYYDRSQTCGEFY